LLAFYSDLLPVVFYLLMIRLSCMKTDCPWGFTECMEISTSHSSFQCPFTNLHLLCSALQVSADGGFAGTMLFHHPITDRQRYTAVDEAYRTACCNAQTCAKYFMRREINTCQGYVPPAVGMYYVALTKCITLSS
jgi:hypothetical protein